MITMTYNLLIGILFLGNFYIQEENYPVPKESDAIVFYIQRNHNSNTIVYEANYDENGNLDKDEPIKVYWRRYDEEGQKMDLRTFEKWYVFGVSWENTQTENMYKVSLAANKKREFWIKQIAPFKSILITEINDTRSQIIHAYIYADESGIIPKIKYVELFGANLKGNNNVYQKIIKNK